MSIHLIEVLKSYASHGFCMVPVGYKTKKPLEQDWPNKASSDPNLFLERHRGKILNVGIVTGSKSQIVVLDVDPKNGGLESLKQLQKKFGPLPPTPTVLTGGNGFHFYFFYPEPIGNRIGFLPGLDLKGDKGFVVAPPSIHESGESYTWDPLHSLENTPLAPLPSFLRDVCFQNTGSLPSPFTKQSSVYLETVTSGGRNTRLASVYGTLLRRYGDPAVSLVFLHGYNLICCNPPLDNAEVTRVAQSILKLHSRNFPHG